MATIKNPGPFDCYAKLDINEPYFLFRAKDPVAACFVEAWRAIRAGDLRAAENCMRNAQFSLEVSGLPLLSYNNPKSLEAQDVALEMTKWRIHNVS